MVADALAAISVASGLVFINDRPTDEEPSEARASLQRSRYGDRWAPVLIAWSDPSRSPDLTKNVIGQGGSVYLDTRDKTPFDPRTKVYITGTLALDGPAFANLQPKGAVYRGFAEQLPDRRYGPGAGLRPMPVLDSAASDLRESARGPMLALVAALGESANLVVLSGVEARFIVAALNETAHQISSAFNPEPPVPSDSRTE